MNLKDYPELITPKDTDWLLIQENDTIPAYKKIKLINLGVGGGSASGGNSQAWAYRDGSVATFDASPGERILVDPANNVAINLANFSPGDSIEFKLLNPAYKVSLTGISKLDGTNINSNDVIQLNLIDNSVKVIYVNSIIGWVSIPKAGVFIKKQLALPTNGLQQLFYAANIEAVNNAVLANWNDASGNIRHAAQSTVSTQPVFKTNIFSAGIPSVYFAGSNYFETDLSYIVNQKYTVAVVEARASDKGSNYFFGQSQSGGNQALHIGYRDNNQFTLAQWANDLNTSVPTYTNSLVPIIWVVSNNSRGKEIYRNGVKIASSSNTDNLTSGTNGRLGRATDNFIGHLGLVASWTGNKSEVEINEIFTAINSTFGIY